MRLLHPAVAVAAVVVASSVPALAGADLEDAVRLFIETPYAHGVPYDAARALGPQALPVLEKCLADADFKPYWSNVVSTIGYIGDAGGYRLLRDFVRDRFVGEVDRETFQALIAAQGVVGHIAAFDAPEALRDLEQGVDPAAWSDLQWSYRHYQGEELGMLWSKLTINSLANTGKPSAGSVLERLQARPFADKQRSNIDEGLVRHADVARLGLVDFMNAQASNDSGQK